MSRTDRNLAPFTPLSRVFEQFFDEPFFTLMPVQTQGTQQSFAMDLSEDDQNVIVRATLPGFKKEEINVELDEGVLTIAGQHEEEHEEGGPNEKYYRRERRLGSVQRRIALPMAVREDEAVADLKDGVLTLKLPKVQKAPARKISIGENAPSETGVTEPRPTGQRIPVGGRK
jgi:HSP20 family protein